jgi:hypothetical protein
MLKKNVAGKRTEQQPGVFAIIERALGPQKAMAYILRELVSTARFNTKTSDGAQYKKTEEGSKSQDY